VDSEKKGGLNFFSCDHVLQHHQFQVKTGGDRKVVDTTIAQKIIARCHCSKLVASVLCIWDSCSNSISKLLLLQQQQQKTAAAAAAAATKFTEKY
jgi:hypothetical protein